MISEPTLRGYVLEEVLARLLLENGYSLLVDARQDRAALTAGPNGLMVRGRGADHQADALGELLIPTPFSLPLRLFAEAKFQNSAVDIAAVRNALGVLNDVNEHHGTGGAGDFPLRRYHYRYALFSSKGFTAGAQKYALAHQISLIDLQGPAFSDLRDITKQIARRLLDLARKHGLSSFPLNQMRTALRRALGTWSLESEPDDGSYASLSGATSVDAVGGGPPDRLPADQLARIAAGLHERVVRDALIIGFPQGPFILVLQPDDPEAFDAFLQESPSEVEVNIRYASSGNGAIGEWAIVPLPRRHELIVRFGMPPLLASWLLAAGEAELDRVRLTKKTLLSTIAVFHHGNRLTRLQYAKVERKVLTADQVLSEHVPSLRLELAEPDLVFKGRREDIGFGDLDEDDERSNRQPWTPEGTIELLSRLAEEGYLQGQVIRMAALQHGRISRQQVYELGGYDQSRTLRGFPLPIRRITRQLQQEGLIPHNVSPMLRTVHGGDGRAKRFEIPPDVLRVLNRVQSEL